MSTEITLGDDILDSRDIEARISELEGFGDDLEDFERDELAALRQFRDDARDATSEWDDGAGFILDSYFETYAREFAEDIGAISGDERWPATCIDWERAANELRQDYTEVDSGGYTYWVRA